MEIFIAWMSGDFVFVWGVDGGEILDFGTVERLFRWDTNFVNNG